MGGIFTPHDAVEKILLGANWVQVYTGWIYNGPEFVLEINRELDQLCIDKGYKNIQDAVGLMA